MLSSEKEQGTYSLLLAQPVSLRQIVLAKLSLRAALMVGFLAVISVLSVFVLGINFSENGGLWLRFFLVALAYGLFWLAVILAVVSFQKSSAFNALTLLAVWILLIVVLPAFTQQWLTVSQPIDRSVFENLVRDEYSMERPDSVVLKDYYARHPDRYFPEDTAKRDPELRGYYARNEWVDLTLEPLVQAYEAQVQQREATVETLNWLLPAVNVQELFNGLTNTSTAAHRDYLHQIKAFHGRWNDFFLPKTFKNERLTPSDYALFPKWEFQPLNQHFSVAVGLLKLLLATGLLLGLGWVKLK